MKLVYGAITFLLVVVGNCYQELQEKERNVLISEEYRTRAKENFDIHNDHGLLEPILKVRLPGTSESGRVREHFKEFFQRMGDDWVVEQDQFYDIVPVAPVKGGDTNVSFTNFIATRDPPGAVDGDVGRLALVAHYDSKREPDGFIGAIDSAFPCALILQVIENLNGILTEKWASNQSNGNKRMGLQVILLDGEEALKEWSDTDSVYGARYLAKSWESSQYGVLSTRKNRIDSIDLFVLLDLLGTAKPNIPSYYKHTHWSHQALRKLQGEVSKEEWFPKDPKFLFAGQIGDDHLPFYNFGVPILHLIPIPFPDVWHTINDDGEHLDEATMLQWNDIMTLFVAEYMELSGFI